VRLPRKPKVGCAGVLRHKTQTVWVRAPAGSGSGWESYNSKAWPFRFQVHAIWHFRLLAHVKFFGKTP